MSDRYYQGSTNIVLSPVATTAPSLFPAHVPTPVDLAPTRKKINFKNMQLDTG